MSQGPRTRVRLDGMVYHVVRSSRGTHIYARKDNEEANAPGTMNVLVWDTRSKRNCTISQERADKILAAEAESV